MRAESKLSDKLAPAYQGSRDLLASALSSATFWGVHQQQGKFSSCIFQRTAYWSVVDGNPPRIDSKFVLVVSENVAQIQERERCSCFSS
jgi:hypothetical protein